MICFGPLLEIDVLFAAKLRRQRSAPGVDALQAEDARPIQAQSKGAAHSASESAVLSIRIQGKWVVMGMDLITDEDYAAAG